MKDNVIHLGTHEALRIANMEEREYRVVLDSVGWRLEIKSVIPSRRGKWGSPLGGSFDEGKITSVTSRTLSAINAARLLGIEPYIK